MSAQAIALFNNQVYGETMTSGLAADDAIVPKTILAGQRQEKRKILFIHIHVFQRFVTLSNWICM